MTKNNHFRVVFSDSSPYNPPESKNRQFHPPKKTKKRHKFDFFSWKGLTKYTRFSIFIISGRRERPQGGKGL